MSGPCKAAVLLLAGFAATAAAAAPREPIGAPVVVAERSPPKPTGPIAVHYRFVGQAVVGQAFDVVITARGFGAVGLALETAVSAPEALVVAVQTPGVAGDGERAWVVTVVPMLPRAGYLDVLVTGEIDGVAQARSVVIPIRTVSGKGAEPAPAAVAVDSGGETLILLPVEERP